MSTNNDILEQYGAAIYNAMNARNITLAQMAFLTKTSPRSFARVRDGEVAPPAAVIEIVNNIFNDKSIAKLGQQIVTQYGEKGSSRTPMGSRSSYATRVAHKFADTAYIANTSNSLPFDAHKVASILGVNYNKLILAITQATEAVGKKITEVTRVNTSR